MDEIKRDAKGRFVVGRIVPREWIEKARQANIGHTMPPAQKEKLRNLREATIAERGYWLDEHARQKIRASKIGKSLSLEHRKKISATLKGRPILNMTPERRAQILENFKKGPLKNKGRKSWNSGKTAATDSRILAGKNHYFFGKKLSLERRRKISAAHKGVPLSEERKKRLSYTNSKEKSPHWKGGSSFKPYTPDFSERFKEQIKNRDNHTCQLCLLPETIDRLLNVHHIDYDKLNSVKTNCISLCFTCHGKTNHNRKYWQEILENKIKQIYHGEQQKTKQLALVRPVDDVKKTAYTLQ